MFHAALSLLALSVVGVAVGSLFYLVVSFLTMRRHTPVRSWLQTLSALLFEAAAITVTQPLVPLFYVFGRRLGGARDGRPVIFVHGYFQNRADFVYLAWAARRASLGPLYGFNYNWTRGVPECAAELGRFVEDVCLETGRPQVAIVAHSLGGVVALEYLRTPRGTERVELCVTIASPHAGVTWRVGMVGRSASQLRAKSEYMRSSSLLPLPLRVLSIFSTHDNIVHPAATSALTLRGGDDHEVSGVGHLGLLFSKNVAQKVVSALSA